MPRPFYIIGHNPNCLDDALKYLRRGANAIEPDIHLDRGSDRFRVCHDDPTDGDPFLEHYLDGLVAALKKDSENGQQLRLELIAFDLKPKYDYDLNRLYAIIRERFSAYFPDVLIATTISDPERADFLTAVQGNQRPNELVGIDENTQPEDAIERLEASGLKWSFASGIDLFDFAPLNAIVGPRSFLGRTARATQLRDLRADGLKLVYAWTVNNEADIEAFLALDPPIDALLTDEPERVRQILEAQYALKFQVGTT